MDDLLSIYLNYFWYYIHWWIYFIGIVDGSCKIPQHLINFIRIDTLYFFRSVFNAKEQVTAIPVIERTNRLINILIQSIFGSFKFNIHLLPCIYQIL